MGMDCKKVNKISLVTKKNMAGQSESTTPITSLDKRR